MENNLIASIYFGKTCTLFAIIVKNDNAYCLQYLNTFKAINLNNLDEKEAQETIKKLNETVDNFRESISNFFVTVDTQYSIITKIPDDVELKSSEFAELINLEIRQHFSNQTVDDFKVKITKLHSKPFMNLVIITSKNLIESIENIVANFGFEITDINTSSFSAINAFHYNYPDKSEHINIIVHLNQNILEFAILKNQQILGYEFFDITNEPNISAAIESKINNISNQLNIEEINGIYFFGQNLSKKLYVECWEIGMMLCYDSKRLNPFRMFDTVLENRDNEYCSRMFHTFPACIGGALPIQFPMTVSINL